MDAFRLPCIRGAGRVAAVFKCLLLRALTKIPLRGIIAAEGCAMDINGKECPAGETGELCINLESKMYQIEATDNYEERKLQLENNIYVLTELIQEYMYNYLYHEAALLDELCGWVVFRKFQTGAVTSKMEIRYRKPIHTNEGQLTLRARATEVRRNLVTIVGEIYNSNGDLCTESSCLYFLFSKEKSATEMGLTECRVEGE